MGKKYGNFDIAAFISDTRADGWTQTCEYNTQSVNSRRAIKSRQTISSLFKGIHNELFGNLAVARVAEPVLHQSVPMMRACNSLTRADDPRRLYQPPGAVRIRSTQRHRRTVPEVDGDMAASTATTGAIFSDCAGSMISTKTPNGALRSARTTRTSSSRPARPPRWRMNPPSTPRQTSPSMVAQGHDATSFAGLYFNRTRYFSPTLNVLPMATAPMARRPAAKRHEQNLGRSRA